jgi:hypothetical protein
MRATSYSIYDSFYQRVLDTIHKKCGITGPTTVPPPLAPSLPQKPPTFCTSASHYTTKNKDSCDSIAVAKKVASASLYMSNQETLYNCSSIPPNVDLCLPLPCGRIYTIQPSDTCFSIETAYSLNTGDVRTYNTWIKQDCSNLQSAVANYGRVICLGPQGGTFTGTAPIPGVTQGQRQGGSGEYATNPIAPPVGAPLALGTTTKCGRWHVAGKEEGCASITSTEAIAPALFLLINPSLKKQTCNGDLIVGNAYCVAPVYGWNSTIARAMPTTTK